ncbi:DUF3429 domain-containing protein [Motiliproteus sp.]|uniref:DUF3429 domain-containing protein n=1 Tax=Motiliproteus sp. TaxID=1898955 RepID=UPI003BA969F2
MQTLPLRGQVQTYSWLGVLPFILLGALLPIWPVSIQNQALESFSAYGAVILAFMAGAIWLPAITGEELQRSVSTSMAILLSLLAFLVMLLPIELDLVSAAAAFCCCWSPKSGCAGGCATPTGTGRCGSC